MIGKDGITITLSFLPSPLLNSENSPRNLIDVSLILKQQKSFPFPKKAGYPDIPRTLGEHIRKRRMDLDMPQSEVAERCRVTECTVFNLERGNSAPMISHYPGIIRFLGYHPWYFTNDLKGRIAEYRFTHGLNYQETAKLLGIHGSTLRSWELGTHKPNQEKLEQLEELLTKNATQ